MATIHDPTKNDVDHRRGARGLVHSVSWNVLVGLGWSSVVVIVSTRLLLGALGPSVYGSYAVVTSTIALTGLLRIGGAEATVKYVAEYRASGRLDALSDIIAGTALFYALVSVIGWALLHSSAPWIARAFLSDATGGQAYAERALRIAALGFPPSILTSLALAVFAGHERYELASITSAGSQTVIAVSGVLAARSEPDLVWITSSIVLSSWIYCLLVSALAYRWLGMPSFSLLGSLRGARRVLAFGVPAALSNLGSTAFSVADRLVVAAVAGQEQVAFYSIATSVASRFYTLSVAANNVLLPRFSANQVRDGGASASRRLFWLATSTSLLVSLCGAALLAACGQEALEFWLGGAAAVSIYPSLVVAAIAYAGLATVIVGVYYLNGIGRPASAARWYLAGGTAQLGAMWFLGRLWDRPGLLIGLVLFPVILSGALFEAARLVRSDHDSGMFRKGLGALAAVSVLTATFGVALGAGLEAIHVPLVPRLVAQGLASLGLYGSLSFVAVRRWWPLVAGQSKEAIHSWRRRNRRERGPAS